MTDAMMDRQNSADSAAIVAQLKKYAQDLIELYTAEKEKSDALQVAKQQLEKYAADFAATYESLRSSEKRYRALFEYSPISLWEEDLSQVKKHVDALCASGITDFRTYFAQHPEEVLQCISMITSTDVNSATLILYQADTKEEFLSNLKHILTHRDHEILIEELISLVEGRMFERECVNRTLKGKEITVLIKSAIAPGYEKTWGKVFVSVHDLTELRAFDRSKERIINHLAHELKTPLAIIMSVFGQLSKKLEDARIAGMEKTLERGQRNVQRLLDLQSKIQDIIEKRLVQEKGQLLYLIKIATSIVAGELEDGQLDKNQKREIIKRISDRFESLFSYKENKLEEINLDKCLHDICDEALRCIHGRSLRLCRNIEQGIVLSMDKNVLNKIFSGLVKNAIENTPDGGRIEVTAQSSHDGTWVHVRDYGIGIVGEDQKNIFTGFFHTQDTNLYSTKRPYEFNAGGAGADLLRIKVFSERYGFNIKLESSRCKFRPTDKDACAGQISTCPFITDERDCLSSGGTTVSLHFPKERTAVAS
jgi:signal transduction histidine kinase